MAKRYENLITIINEIKPKVIVEIGTFDGKRASIMMSEALRFHAIEKLRYIGFDLFEQPPDYEGAKPGTLPLSAVTNRIQRYLPKLAFNLIKGNTRETLPGWLGATTGMRREFTFDHADLVFIDGGHSLETIASDWHWIYLYLSKPGTVIVLDDYYYDREDKGCKPLIDGLSRMHELVKVELLDPIDKFKKPDGDLSVQFAKVTIL